MRAVLFAVVVIAVASAVAMAKPHHSHHAPKPSTPKKHHRSLPLNLHPASYVSHAELAATETPAPRVHEGRHKFRAGSVIPMSGGFLTTGAYSVNVSIGGQGPFTLLLDTGSSNLAVPSPLCTTCGPDAVPYDPTRSPNGQLVPFPSQQCSICSPDGSVAPNCPYGQPAPDSVLYSTCGYGISYGGGSSFLGGGLVNDNVSFGEYTVASTFVSMTNEWPNASFSSAPFDGIIGLAHEMNAVNPTYVPTIFSEIVKKYGVDDVFGLCLDPTNGGVIDVGYIDSNKYTGQLQYLPQVQERWYNVDLRSISVGSNVVDVPHWAYSYVNDQIGAFFDSGTSIILLAPLAFTALQNTFQTNYANLPGVSGSSNIFNGLCLTQNVLSQYPTLNFEFTGENGSQVVLPVSPAAYMMYQGGQYCLGIQGAIGIGAVMGDVFMQEYYIVHDRANKRVGLAPVNSCV